METHGDHDGDIARDVTHTFAESDTDERDVLAGPSCDFASSDVIEKRYILS